MTDTPTLTGPLDQWVADATPGARVVYHTGPHAAGSVCRKAMDLADAGAVTLVRKRADKPGTFHYIAVKLGGKHGRKS